MVDGGKCLPQSELIVSYGQEDKTHSSRRYTKPNRSADLRQEEIRGLEKEREGEGAYWPRLEENVLF